MQVKTFLLTAGLSMAAGAAAVLMLPPKNPVRKAADQAAQAAADAIENAADTMLH
ncbi:MAG: hypothetical protein IKS29_02545 [Oscillospiraceae bacterium]|nr:hypothetical protein [Oscillospiraceae bacterium]